MSKQENPAPAVPENDNKKAPRKRRWLRVTFKAAAWCVGILAGLVLLLMCAVAWILTPERLTPLVEKYASEYLKADVRAGRIELTVWKSFPYVNLDVQDLHLSSRSLQGQPDSVMAKLPADAGRLLDTGSLHASINPWHLLRGCVKLGDIEVKGLGVNLVAYSPEVTNYDILPPSEPSEESSTMRFEFSDVLIDASGGIRYFDAAAAIDARLVSPRLTASQQDDTIKLDFKTPVDFTSEGHKYISGMPLSLTGDIIFRQTPMNISTRGLRLQAWGVDMALDLGLDLADSPVLTKASASIAPVQVLPLLKLALPEMLAELPVLKGLDTPLAFGLDATVKTPWDMTSSTLPDVDVRFNIPSCPLSFADKGSVMRLKDLELRGSFHFNGADPASSALSVPLFNAAGDGVALSLTAEVKEALADDPLLRLTSKGNADLSCFRALLPLPGMTLKGIINADASMQCRLSDITDMKLQNIDADGRVEMRGLLFAIPAMAVKLYARMTTLTFGNDMHMHDTGKGLVQGMLRAGAAIDTLYCAVPGIEVALRGMNLRAGTTPGMLAENRPAGVMPLGLMLETDRLVADSEVDTLHISARTLKASGSITRYQGDSKSPLLKADIDAARLRYTDPFTRLGVRNFSADMLAHLRPRNSDAKTPYQRRYDAIAKANPGLSADSVAALASAPRRERPDIPAIDMSVDNGLKSLIRQWGVQGGVRADRVNLTYILYPVRTRIENLALDFSLDSLRLHRAFISSQNNRMSISGTVSNLRQAMLGRVRRPLVVRLFADIDSVDINQLAYNYELGRGLQVRRGVLARINPEDEDALVKAAAEIPVAADEPIDTTTLILPRNIDAQIRLTAREALYTNLALHDLRGSLVLNDGALSVDSLTTATDFGQAYLNLLYSSRDPQDLNMSVDLGFNRVNLADFYTSFPQVTQMMPIITNLNGMVGAALTGSFNLYPNMDIDMGSINAMLNITGSNLELTQDPLIRKVARMMFIRKKGNLHISDMNIQVSVHDNVMRLYPFAFSMEKYKFALLGENDLDQNMYYHLSVLNSPVPWKFGINIKGTFDNPKFRFGGAKYHENEAREVVNLVQTERVNFVKAMRLQLHKLVNRAALNYADRQEPDESRERQDQSMQDTPYNDPAEEMSHVISDPIARALGKNADLLRKIQSENAKKKKK